MSEIVSNEELVQLYQLGNKSALNELIEQNTGIINKVISRFYINSNSIDKEDLFQEGCIGLMVASQRYDINNLKKAKFITYAVNWISQKISRFLKQKNTNDETSLDKPISQEGEASLIDVISSNEDLEDNIVEKMYQYELSRDLKKTLLRDNTLLEREIIEFYYGLYNTIPLNAVQIGEILDIKGCKARYNLSMAMTKLKRSSYRLPLKSYRDDMEQEHKARKYSSINNLLFNMESDNFEKNIRRNTYSGIIKTVQNISSSI